MKNQSLTHNGVVNTLQLSSKYYRKDFMKGISRKIKMYLKKISLMVKSHKPWIHVHHKLRRNKSGQFIICRSSDEPYITSITSISFV